MSPATAEDDTASDPEDGFTHDYQQGNAGLKGVGDGVEPPAEEWQRAVADMLPPPQKLDGLNAGYLGCGRIDGEAPCSTRRCSYRWMNRGFQEGLIHETVAVFNHWGGASAAANGGTGTIRGCPVKDAARLTLWMRYMASRGSNVELPHGTARDVGEARRGLGHTTAGKSRILLRARGQPLSARRKKRHPSGGIQPLGRGVRVCDSRSRRESKNRSRHRVGRVQDAACSDLLPRFGHSLCGPHDARLPHVWRIGLQCTT